MKLSTKIAALALAAAALAPMSGASATQYVMNGGFESTTLANSQALFGPNTPATDWSSNGDWILFCSASGAQCDQIAGDGLWPGTAAPSPQGGNFMGIDGTPGFDGVISQTINGLTTGQSLTLSFYMATAQEYGGGPTTETLTATLGGESFTTPTISTPLATESPWILYSTTFTYDGTGNVLSFVNAGTGTPPYALIDGVSLTGAAGTPEPGVWMLMLAGFGGLGALARRRRAMILAAAA